VYILYGGVLNNKTIVGKVIDADFIVMGPSSNAL